MIMLMTIEVSAAFGSQTVYDTSEQMEAVGANDLPASLPEETNTLMEKIGIDEVTPENIIHLAPGDFFRTIWQSARNAALEPLHLLGVIIGIVSLCAMIGGLQSGSWEKGISEIFAFSAALCTLVSVTSPIVECIVQTSQIIKSASNFMLVFIPVFSAALVASGQPITGSAYHIFLFSTCQAVAQVISQLLIPLMNIYLGTCMVGNLLNEIKVESAAGRVKSILSWVLGLLLTVFIGVLSVQTMVAGNADSLSMRTAKFFVGSFVPVVGNALSEALVAAQGCLKLIRTSIGAYGIIAALLLFLPAFLRLFLWYIVTNLGVVIGDIMGVTQISRILKSCSAALGILIAILLCYALLIIVSTTIVMVTSGLGA